MGWDDACLYNDYPTCSMAVWNTSGSRCTNAAGSVGCRHISCLLGAIIMLCVSISSKGI